jgi:hypothetical protein
MYVLWISIGVIVGSLLIFALVAARTAGRLGQLRRAQRRIQRLQGSATTLEPKIADLQASLELLQARSTRTTEHVAALTSARSGSRDDARP